MKTELFIIAAKQILGFKKPVEIRIHPDGYGKTKEIRGYSGWCDTQLRKGKILKHVLHINMPSVYESKYRMTDVIAHEMIHAIMIERNRFNEKKHHDKKFQKICKMFEENMRTLGFTIGELYNPNTDTD